MTLLVAYAAGTSGCPHGGRAALQIAAFAWLVASAVAVGHQQKRA